MDRDPGPRWLDVFLAVLVVVPALAIAWGRDGEGRLAFVLYREPKLIVVAVLGWIFVAALAWTRRTRWTVAALRAVVGRPAVVILLVFLGYMATTGLWARVPENYFYEINQYALLAVLLVGLLLLVGDNAGVVRRVRYALVASLAVVTGVGVLQAAGLLAALAPIDPQIGSRYPSLMGYKNPAALALLGQIFLLAQLVAGNGEASSPPRRRLALAVLLAAELVYLAALGSRTSYVALAVGFLFLAVLHLLRRPSPLRLVRLAGAAAGLALIAAAFLAIHEPSRARARTLRPYLERPLAYLDTDRGTYLRNTVHMARHHPFGVGLGDWQSFYPVFRLHNRDLSFSDRYQVRRAHSDHVQFLGEGGWPGLAAWLAFLAVLIGSTASRYLRTGRGEALFAAAQLVAFAAAMAFDYLLEIPYNKFQFFLVVFLALASHGAERQAPAETRTSRRGATLLAVGFALVATLQIGYHAALARKVHLAATIEHLYLATDKLAPARREAVLRRLVDRGLEFAALPGHTKTFHKDFLLIGHSAHLLGRQRLAVAAVGRALELHPYHPNSLRAMAVLVGGEAAAQWRAAYDHVMTEATDGFALEYPELPP